MDLFDSNIWLHGCLFRDSEPADLVNEAARGERDVYVSAYIFNEVISRLENPKSRYEPDHIERAKQLFTQIAVHSPSVDMPSQSSVERMDHRQEAIAPSNSFLGELLDIQAKDAPVLVAAWGLNRHIDLYTCDRAFAACDLSKYGIDYIPIYHVEPP
ncbi:PIN domain-containing protein [Halopenitus salinus]|uniref:PIN domain-containing protein n=1 Tax=Halopenitus salinus TaxID=1198295 RepID=A0ABD5UUL5_9EURY